MRFPGTIRPAIVALVFSLPVREAPAQTSDDLFDGGVLQDIHLVIDAADWQSLRTHYEENTYYPCSLRWQGQVVENIGIRSRGYGSRNGTKPGLRIDFNRYLDEQEFLGLKALILDNGTQDAAFIKERLSMLLFQRLGFPSPRVAHARLFVNDTYAGLYGVVESVDKAALKQFFGEHNGDVENDGYLYEFKWKYNYYFTYLGADLAPYAELFEPQTHEEEPPEALYAPIKTMIQVANQVPDEDFQNTMSDFLDLRLLMAYVAIENFIAEWDGILGYWGMNNFYIYRFEDRILFQPIPWDKDYTFKAIQHSIFWNAEDNVLLRRALAIPELRAAYLQALLDAGAVASEGATEGGAREPVDRGWLELEIEREYGQIRAAARSDTLKPFSNDDFEAEISYLLRFARERGDFVRSQVDAAQPPEDVPAAGIDLGDVAAGGDGSGTAAPEVVGINPDTGFFENSHENGPIGIADGRALTPLADVTSPFIDSVFIIDRAAMPINSAGVTFDFPPEDLLNPPSGWDHILNNRIGGEDFPVSVGGANFQSGVGIHAAAGITYDLDAIRERHGAAAAGTVTAFAGMGDSPSCVANPGVVTAYLILSSSQEVLESVSYRTSNGGALLRLPIPPEVRFVTLAAGAGNGTFYCNSGTFANAFITPSPLPAFRRGDCNGDGQVSGVVTDALVMLNFNFLGGPAPPCLAACDADGDGLFRGSVTDAVFLLNFNFLGGPRPREPFPGCGSGSEIDVALGCQEPPANCP